MPTKVASVPASSAGSKPAKPFPGSCTEKYLNENELPGLQPATLAGSLSTRLITTVLYLAQLSLRFWSLTTSQTMPVILAGAAMYLVSHLLLG